MQRFRVRYGYLATYQELLLLRQVPSTKESGRWILQYSPVFCSRTKSEDFDLSQQKKEDRVSLREALFFLAVKSILHDKDERDPILNEDPHWKFEHIIDTRSMDEAGSPSDATGPTLKSGRASGKQSKNPSSAGPGHSKRPHGDSQDELEDRKPIATQYSPNEG